MSYLDALDLEPEHRKRARDNKARFIANRIAVASLGRKVAAMQQELWDRQLVMRGSLAGLNLALEAVGLELDERIDLDGELFAVGEGSAVYLGNTPEDDDYDLASETEQTRIDLAHAQYAGNIKEF